MKRCCLLRFINRVSIFRDTLSTFLEPNVYLIRQFLKYEQPIFGLILLAFHSLIWLIEPSVIHFSTSVILLGLFLLWQPIWNKEQTPPLLKILLPSVLFLILSYFLPYEALILFGLLTLGIFGSRILDKNSSRGFDLLAISILTIEISIGIVPHAFAHIVIPPLFSSLIESLLLAPILLFFFSGKIAKFNVERQNIDALHGLLTSSLIALVLLGGIVINVIYGVDYIEGLLLTLFFVVVFILGVSWFWNPSIGFSGLGVIWNRYSMSIGGPFETWINSLTTLIEETYLTPDEYLQSACDNLTENDWLMGLEWITHNTKISSGQHSDFKITHQIDEISHVDLYFKTDPGTALKHHTQLLVRMAHQFYFAKKNQDKIRQQEHLETIHHTGARLTHDIKNILQSIKTSLSIIHLEPDLESNKAFKLLDANLTQISSRLESTLNQLKTPQLNIQFHTMSLNKWLYKFTKELSDTKVEINSRLKFNPSVPVELLDSVLNNLLSNALRKPEVSSVVIQVKADQDLLFISVCDNGDRVSEASADDLFKKPVSSGQGMGIGLYQSALMAHSFNFELDLINNEDGEVCFSLIQHFND